MKRKAKPTPVPEGERFLVNKLTVDDARHLLKVEGGYLTPLQLGISIVFIVFVSAMTARAIIVGEATAWHLTLPMVAEYLVLVFSLPFIYLALRHPGLKKDAMASVRLIIAIVAVIAVTVVLRAIQDGRPWREQLDGDATSFWKWIVDAQMQWPILAAMIGAATAMPGRVENLYKHGPPFAGVSLGCAIRFLLLFLGVFLLPIIVSHPKWTVWAVWGVIILADAVALWMHWDIQTRLEKFDKGSSLGTSA